MNSVRTAKETPHFTVMMINWLMLFKEIIAVYSKNITKHINSKCSLTVPIVKVVITRDYFSVLKG
jgi:hypothetical protein